MASGRLPPTVRPFQSLGLTNVQTCYSPGVALFRQDAENATSNNAVRRLLTRNFVEQAQAQPHVLRWKVVTHTSAKYLPLSTQRNRLRRRWSSAIVASLGKHNLGVDGRLRDRSSTGVMKGAQELGGTLEVLIHRGEGFEMEGGVMQGLADQIVEGLLRSGLGARKVTGAQLGGRSSENRPGDQPIRFRVSGGGRERDNGFDPSRHMPSWKNHGQNMDKRRV